MNRCDCFPNESRQYKQFSVTPAQRSDSIKPTIYTAVNVKDTRAPAFRDILSSDSEFQPPSLGPDVLASGEPSHGQGRQPNPTAGAENRTSLYESRARLADYCKMLSQIRRSCAPRDSSCRLRRRGTSILPNRMKGVFVI